MLADAVHKGLAGDQPLESALAEYELRRDKAILPGYRDNLRSAQLQPVPTDVLRLRRALCDKPVDTTRYFLAFYGLIPYEDFFNPANLERILDSDQEANNAPRGGVGAARSAYRGGPKIREGAGAKRARWVPFIARSPSQTFYRPSRWLMDGFFASS